MILLLLYNTMNGQARTGFEEYYYAGRHLSSVPVSRVYYQGSSSWYGEARYNYEEEKSFSLYAGRTFSRQDTVSYSFTPMAGIVAGKFNGGSAGMNIAFEYRNFFFSSESEYCFSARSPNFFFNWSELGYQCTKHIYAGLVLQQTCLYNATTAWEPGVQLDISFGKWVFPVYAFNPWGSKSYFVLGIAREWEHHKQH
jgi:hypothetical protein